VKRDVSLKSESDDGKTKVYEISVTVSWPPSGKFSMKGLRTVHEATE
jgi:hypothetical protein